MGVTACALLGASSYFNMRAKIHGNYSQNKVKPSYVQNAFPIWKACACIECMGVIACTLLRASSYFDMRAKIHGNYSQIKCIHPTYSKLFSWKECTKRMGVLACTLLGAPVYFTMRAKMHGTYNRNKVIKAIPPTYSMLFCLKSHVLNK